MMDDLSNPDETKNKVLSLYAAFGAGLIFSVLPFVVAAVVSIVLGLGVLAAAYMARAGTAQESFVHNHTTFMIRTIWIGSFFALFMTAVAAVFLFFTLDNTPLQPCLAQVMNGNDESLMMDATRMQAIFSGCFHDYWVINLYPLIGAGAISAGPVMVYFIARYARGLSAALKDQRLEKPLAWF